MLELLNMLGEVTALAALRANFDDARWLLGGDGSLRRSAMKVKLVDALLANANSNREFAVLIKQGESDLYALSRWYGEEVVPGGNLTESIDEIVYTFVPGSVFGAANALPGTALLVGRNYLGSRNIFGVLGSAANDNQLEPWRRLA